MLGIGGFRVTCNNRNLRLRLQEGRIAGPSLQLIGGEQSHGDRARTEQRAAPRARSAKLPWGNFTPGVKLMPGKVSFYKVSPGPTLSKSHEQSLSTKPIGSMSYILSR